MGFDPKWVMGCQKMARDKVVQICENDLFSLNLFFLKLTTTRFSQMCLNLRRRSSFLFKQDIPKIWEKLGFRFLHDLVFLSTEIWLKLV